MNFKKLENNRPFAKIAFQGFAGDGKSFTATQVAIGIHKMIHSAKPIAIFDTEKAFKNLKSQFDDAGIEAVCDDESRSLASLNAAIKWCENGGADVLIIDSITHVYENFIQAYMDEKRRTRLEFQDWGILKPMWKREFSTPFVQAKVHIIFTGRAGYEYETEVVKEEGKRDRKEIHKSGIKMKAENETAFEPDMLVMMEKNQDILGDKKTITREATILKDRTTQIDGQTFTNPTFKDFYPAISKMLDGAYRESTGMEIPDKFEDWEGKWSKIAKERDSIVSEIEGTFNFMGLGTSAADKGLKSATLNKVFGVMSVDNLSTLKVEVLRPGVDILKRFANKYNEYMAECLEGQIKPDMKHIGSMLDEMLKENQLTIA